MGTALIALGTLAVGVALGYFTRRSEHRRDRRIDAFGQLVTAFFSAARTGADLRSVQLQIGYPHELKLDPLTEEQITRMRALHAEAWEAAIRARHDFELAAFGVDLVATRESSTMIVNLREYLDMALYSGAPWGYSKDDPVARINPADVVPMALERVGPEVHRMREALWGRGWRYWFRWLPGVGRRTA